MRGALFTRIKLSRPFGTYAHLPPVPNAKALGYYRLSLRDKQRSPFKILVTLDASSARTQSSRNTRTRRRRSLMNWPCAICRTLDFGLWTLDLSFPLDPG